MTSVRPRDRGGRSKNIQPGPTVLPVLNLGRRGRYNRRYNWRCVARCSFRRNKTIDDRVVEEIGERERERGIWLLLPKPFFMTLNSRIVNLDYREQREAPATLIPIVGSRILKVIKLTFAFVICSARYRAIVFARWKIV